MLSLIVFRLFAAAASVVGLAALRAPAPAPAPTAHLRGHRSQLLRTVNCLRPSRGVGTAVRGSWRLPPARWTAAAHHKENLNALQAREILAQLREGIPNRA